ncbi:serine-rich adhesin for platelets-like [Wyeomyia smithii]|uniref:serine-rich adhesin for platelets-like n=1 Tax=Wyeomyia smithii TaxID=174621 RepID=UPI0024681F7C|nr:serine-rich adhesin for platelets-like [Wyeomyia smithii]XP_055549957.1 serine-rich adhesin for platelets-like [Wyeomyia smithii]
MIGTEESIRLDQEIAHKLQNEHPEQFVTLVRMHLSFELDLNTDTENDPTGIEKLKSKKWKGFHKKGKSCTSAKSTSPETEKSVLTKHNIRDVEQLINFLIQEKNIIQEGIFRKTGSLNRQNELKNALVQGITICLEKGDFTAHDCASVLKSFLADLSEPLLTEHYYSAYCQVAQFCHSKESLAVREDRLLNIIQLLVLLLPKENSILLKCIIDMLHKTIQHEALNKMSADNLATLFTPHLICPRKLSPEALHATAQQMCSIVSFMIRTGPQLFHIPPRLATDIRAFFLERKRRKTMSPDHILNESITSDSVANTVYTFVDREKTAEAHVMNSTDTALAQLYAHIQSLPESSRKKKLIKQFNRENGHGTPLQVLMLREKNSGGSTTSKGPKKIGDSIKRHIFHKGIVSKTPKRKNQTPACFQTPNGTVSHIPKQRVLFQTPVSSASSSPITLGKRCSTVSSSSSSSSDGGLASSDSGKSSPTIGEAKSSNSSTTSTSTSSCQMDSKRTVEFSIDGETKSKKSRVNSEETNDEPSPPEDDEDFVEQEGDHIDDTDEDELRDEGTTLSDNEEDHFCSPNLSDSRSKFKSEPNLTTVVYEESRARPSNGKERKLSFLKNKLIKGVSMGSLRLPFGQENRSAKKSSSSTSLLKCCFEDHLKNAKRSIEGRSSSSSMASIDSPVCRRSSDKQNVLSSLLHRTSSVGSEEYDTVNLVDENNANMDVNNWNVVCLTNTPALSGRESMSPITKSTQRMPKSMQESIMTPRSRKPVMLLAGMNTGEHQQMSYTNQSSFSSLREEDENETTDVTSQNEDNYVHSTQGSTTSTQLSNNAEIPVCSNDSTSMTEAGALNLNDESTSLTSTFRDYLLSRSVLTDSPADLSFSSQPDDFDTSAELDDLSESKMSESLLFCMNGNQPVPDETLINPRKVDPIVDSAIADDSTRVNEFVLSSETLLDETSL